MPIQVTRTKVVLPRRRTDLLSRQRLLDLLYDLMDYKLVIVAAPAGYGKTSLLIDFAYKSDLVVCWYSVDALDTDPARFIAHFINAIANRFPEFGGQSLMTLESNLQSKLDLDNLVTTIVNESYEHIREHFLLVIDDYHLVNNQKEISHFISRFIQDVDENCHVVLLSRALLTLPDMPLLVARSMVGGLSFEELSFQTAELQALVMQNYNIVMPKTTAEDLAQAAQGWITGLLLSTRPMMTGMQDRLRVARVSRVRIDDYFSQQVLDFQPRDVREFLLKTSLFEEFNLQLCEAILGSGSDWSGLIDFILQNNLFVLPVGEDGRSIRYHHLFLEFLQNQLALEYPEERIRILERMMAYYAQEEEWEKAHAISKLLGNPLTTADLIDRAGPSMIRNGRLALLAEWIDQLPAQITDQNPHLLSLRAVPDIVLGQTERGLEMLNRAIAALRLEDDAPGLARSLARRATVLRFMGKYQESCDDAMQALALVDAGQSPQSYQADALRSAGASLYQLGEIPQAIEYLRQAQAIYNSLGEQQNVATLMMELGLVMMDSGQNQAALQLFDQALDYWRTVNNTVRQANLLNNLGVLNHLMGNYEQAATTFEEALARARQNRYTRMEAYILSSIGDLYADLDANKSALELYQKSRELAKLINNHFLLLYTDIATAARYRAMGNLDQAQRYLEGADLRLGKAGSHFERGLYSLELGNLLMDQNKIPAAVAKLELAVQNLESAGQTVEAARASIRLANGHYQAKNLPAAFEALEHALTLAARLDSQHVLVVVGMTITGLLEAAKDQPRLEQSAANLLDKSHTFEANIPALRKRLRPRTSAIPFAPPKLVIYALGKALVERDGRPVIVPEWQNQRKVRELFYLLLTYPRGMTKEEIGLIFWPESSAAQLKLQFKNAIYRLRHALGPDIVMFNGETYWFNHDLDYEYDVESFTSLLAAAQVNGPVENQTSSYRTALDIYQGSFLPEGDGAWILAERERLRKMFVSGALSLAQLLLENRDYIAALGACQRVLDVDPCQEEAHRLAMQIHALRGNRAEVHRQFERCKLALKIEIDALPSPQTLSLYESLLH